MSIYDSMKLDKIKEIKLHVESNAEKIDDIINDIIQPYVRDLDKYVEFIKDILKDGENPPTVYELEDFCMNLSTNIYFAGGMQERLGVKDDIAKAIYKEMYNSTRDTAKQNRFYFKHGFKDFLYLKAVFYTLRYE